MEVQGGRGGGQEAQTPKVTYVVSHYSYNAKILHCRMLKC